MTTAKKRNYLEDMFCLSGIDEEEYLPIIDFIIKDGFEIKGWMLDEIPAKGRYCFRHRRLNRFFDLVFDGKSVKTQYMDSKDGEYFNTMFDAASIKDAVDKYNWPEVGVSPINS